MRRGASLTPVLFAIFACGPGVPDSGATTDSGSSTGAASTGTTTGAPTTSTGTTALPATSSTTGPDTTGPDISGTTLDPGTTTTGPDPSTTSTTSTTSTITTGDSSTGPPPIVEYAAQFWAGGLDHLQVRKADLGADLCTSIAFALPGGLPMPGLQLPGEWFYQGATIHQGAAGCLDFMAPQPAPIIAAELAQGSGTWAVDIFCPASVDLDITLTFPQDQPWVPAQAVMLAAAIPVQGC